jgi:EmrB/QacA subfamily drug resistance transporter
MTRNRSRNGLKEVRNAQLTRSPPPGKDIMKAPADVAGQPLSGSPRTAGLVSEKVAVSVVFVAAMFMSIMDTTIVNVALPTIGRDFSVSPTSVDSVSIAYLVSLAVFIPASGWLGDRFGGKRVLLTAIAVFSVASALCGLASSLGELVAFRVLQGAGGGMLAPVGMAMLYRVFPPAERIRAASILTVPTTLAPALGPVLGGLLVTDLSWRWVFYVNVPIGAAALAFGARFLRQHAQTRPGHFDLAGFLLSGIGLGLLMYGVSEGPDLGWASAEVLGTVTAGVVLLVAMVAVELHSAEPIVALRLLSNRLFRSSTGVLTLTSVGFLGTLYAISLYYQDGRGLTALGSGLSTFPEAIGVMIGAQLASRVLYPILGPRRHIAFGLAGAAATIPTGPHTRSPGSGTTPQPGQTTKPPLKADGLRCGPTVPGLPARLSRRQARGAGQPGSWRQQQCP